MDAYYKFSAFIRAAQKEICGPGLLLDLHAQAHPGNRTELGYGIDTLNSGVFSARHSNVRALGRRVCGRSKYSSGPTLIGKPYKSALYSNVQLVMINCIQVKFIQIPVWTHPSYQSMGAPVNRITL